MDKELEKNKREARLEKSREDKLLAFIGVMVFFFKQKTAYEIHR